MEQIIYDIILNARFKGASDKELLDTTYPIIKFSEINFVLKQHGKNITEKPYSTLIELFAKRPDVPLMVYKRLSKDIKPKYKIVEYRQTYSARKGCGSAKRIVINNISKDEALLFMSRFHPNSKNNNGTYNVSSMLSAYINIINQSTGETLKL